jgi:hypothetical protein
MKLKLNEPSVVYAPPPSPEGTNAPAGKPSRRKLTSAAN